MTPYASCFSWIVQAMQLELNYMKSKQVFLSNMSPSAVKKLLKQTLTVSPSGHDNCRSVERTDIKHRFASMIKFAYFSVPVL